MRDPSDIIAAGRPMVKALEDQNNFRRVFLEIGAPTWPSGFDPDPFSSTWNTATPTRWFPLPRG